jgi:leukotriene-A4 hydrolase
MLKYLFQDYKPSPKDIEGLTASQIVVFLEAIQFFDTPLTPAQSQLLGSTYSLTDSRNVEVLARYFEIGLSAKDESVYQPTADFLGKVGRMKFVRPLYKKLAACDKEFAEQTFETHKNFYHPICRNMVTKDLKGVK